MSRSQGLGLPYSTYSSEGKEVIHLDDSSEAELDDDLPSSHHFASVATRFIELDDEDETPASQVATTSYVQCPILVMNI